MNVVTKTIALMVLMIPVVLARTEQCPPGAKCREGYARVTAVDDQLMCVPAKCLLPLRRGKCRSRKPRFYFDKNTMSCRPFNYGGCGGNPNRFHNFLQCKTVCSPKCPCIT